MKVSGGLGPMGWVGWGGGGAIYVCVLGGGCVTTAQSGLRTASLGVPAAERPSIVASQQKHSQLPPPDVHLTSGLPCARKPRQCNSAPRAKPHIPQNNPPMSLFHVGTTAGMWIYRVPSLMSEFVPALLTWWRWDENFLSLSWKGEKKTELSVSVSVLAERRPLRSFWTHFFIFYF